MRKLALPIHMGLKTRKFKDKYKKLIFIISEKANFFESYLYSLREIQALFKHLKT